MMTPFKFTAPEIAELEPLFPGYKFVSLIAVEEWGCLSSSAEFIRPGGSGEVVAQSLGRGC